MYFKQCLVVLSFLFLTIFASGQTYPINLEVENASLVDVFSQIEKENGFLFSYPETAIDGIRISGSFHSTSINEFLAQLLLNKELDFEVVENRYVLIYQINDKLLKESGISLPSLTFCGQILDEKTGDPLVLANIFIPNRKKGIAADLEGKFKYQIEAELSDQVIISYIGYQDKILKASDISNGDCSEIYLKLNEIEQGLVVVTDYITDGISLRKNGDFTDVHPQKLKTLPGQSDGNVLNSIQFLPGVTSTDGSSASLSIRGGSSDQNLILWEDIPLYHSAHYFGMISALNPEIMDQARVFRGGFGADYGGRISGLIDLKSKNNIDRKKNFGLGLNFINASAHGNLSLLENKLNIIYSVRRSISEIWRSPTYNSITRRIQQGILLELENPGRIPKDLIIEEDFNFLDANVSANVNLSNSDNLEIAWLYGNNDFKSTIDNTREKSLQNDSLYLKNSGTKIKWNHLWNSKFQSSISFLSSDYFYDYDYEVKSQNENGNRKNGIKSSKINEKQLHFSNNYSLKDIYENSIVEIKLGYQLTRYNVSHQIINQLQNNPQDDVQRDLTSNVHATYTSFNSSTRKKIGFNLGIRYSYFEKEKSNYFSPRLRLWYQPNNLLQFNFKAGRYQQFLSQLIQIAGDNSSIETPVWVLAGNQEVPVLSSNQFQIGGVFMKNRWTVELQGYYKTIDGLSSLATGFDEMIQGNYKPGTAKIKGFDFLIKKRWFNYQSWASYSLSQIDHSFPRFFDLEFSANIEQPHILQWVHLYKLKNFNFSIGWKGSSGTPFSLIENFEVRTTNNGPGTKETIVPIVNEYNSGRLPFRHQLDATILYNIPASETRKWKAVIGFSILNIYNQKNFIYRSFFIDKKPDEKIRLNYTNKTDLGITPNLNIQFYW